MGYLSPVPKLIPFKPDKTLESALCILADDSDLKYGLKYSAVISTDNSSYFDEDFLRQIGHLA